MMGTGPLLPSQTPYSVLDYGVTAMVLIVLGVVLFFVFRSMRQILTDHARAMGALAETMVLMKESILTLVVDTRHLHSTVDALGQRAEDDRTARLTQLEEAARRHLAEHKHRTETTEHIQRETG